MGKFTLEVTIPGDRWDLPILVSFSRENGGEYFKYRTAGTMEKARKDANKVLTRLNKEYRLPGVFKL